MNSAMSSALSTSRRNQLGIALLCGSCLSCISGAQAAAAPPTSTTARWRDVSMEDYRRHLVNLSELVQSCAKERNGKACDPALVGPDDRVPLSSGPHSELRLIRYGWLRVLLLKAEDPDQLANTPAKQSNMRPAVGSVQENPSTSQLLKDAKQRLDSDLAQSRQPFSPAEDHAAQRAAMAQVLAGPEFRNLKERTVKDSISERIQNWLNRLFASVANLKTHSAWLGRLLVWGFIFAVCVALIWPVIRLERRWRVRLVPEDGQPSAGAPSARDWQLWMEDARRAAASGSWREAIHLVYWASISRLESRRLWPADRARTPREYLALVAREDTRRHGLAQLTNTFERLWYGGRAAAEGDYKHAETLATALIQGSTHAAPSDLSVAQKGGPR